MDISKSVIPALIIPILLIVATSVYMSTTDSTSFVFEEAVSAEDTGTDAAAEEVTAYTVYPCKKDSITAVTNGTTAMTAVTDYNVTYTPLDVATIVVGAHIDAGDIKATYTAYKGSGYDAFDKMNDQSYAGFKLASLLPFVVIAMVTIVLVIGALVLR